MTKAPQLPDDPRKYANGIDEKGNLTFAQVGVEQLSYRGRWGAVARSDTQNTVAIGEHTFVIADDDNLFKIGDDVLCTCLDDVNGFMWGEIIAKSTTSPTTQLTVYVEDISNGIITSSNWELQVVSRPKFGITKDTSATSVNPTAAGPFTFTVTSGKFFPIGGKLLMIPLADRSIALVGTVKAYSSTSLVVSKNSTNATVSTSYTSWAIALLDAPQDKVPLYSITGLKVRANGSDPTHDIDISAGVVRDSTDTIDLVLTTNLTKQLDAAFAAGTNAGAYIQSANLTGTISSSGTTVTGSGTSFLTDFVTSPGTTTLDDFDAQYQVWKGTNAAASVVPNSIITANGVTARILVTSNTAGTSSSALGAGAGTTYKRGGFVSDGTWAIVLIRKDSDGSVDVCAAAWQSGGGAPDLPSGYTYYRIIAGISFFGVSNLIVVQPLQGINAPNSEAVDISSTEPFETLGSDLTVQDAIEDIDGFLTIHGAAIDTNTTAVAVLQAGTSPTASSAAAGFVELAIASETASQTDTARAVTPSSLDTLLPRALYKATITPTAVAGSCSAVNSTTDAIAWSVAHGLTTGDQVRGIGTTPTGWTVGQVYYVEVLTSQNFALYTTLSGALSSTGRVDLTTTTTGATMVRYVPSAVYSRNMRTNGMVLACLPGTTTIGFQVNFNTGITVPSTNVVSQLAARNLSNTTPATVTNWLQLIPTSFGSSTITFSDIVAIGNATSAPGTWVNQGTTAYQVSFIMWSDA